MKTKKTVGRIEREKGYIYHIDRRGYIWRTPLKEEQNQKNELERHRKIIKKARK